MADANDSTADNVAPVIKKKSSEDETGFFSYLDETHSYLSENVEVLAKNLDEFFSSDNVLYNSSGTYVRLREDLISKEGGEARLRGDVKLRLQLPHTQKKLRLSFESNPHRSVFDDGSEEGISASVNSSEEEDFGAELQAIIGKDDGWQFKPSIGAYLTSQIDPYIKFNFNRRDEFAKWSLNWDETPYKIDSVGWGMDSYFELNRKIGDNHIWRSATFAGWLEETGITELRQVFSFNTKISDKKAISYFAGVFGNDEPKINTTQFLIGINYRQNFHKDYLFFELKPQVLYDKETNFAAEHSMIFRLEILVRK